MVIQAFLQSPPPLKLPLEEREASTFLPVKGETKVRMGSYTVRENTFINCSLFISVIHASLPD